MKGLAIYQTFFDERSRQKLSRSAVPFDVSFNNASDSREYSIFKLINKIDTSSDFIGVLSWKFQDKCQLEVSQFLEFAEKRFNEGAECVFINPMIASEAIFATVWEQGFLNHPVMPHILLMAAKKHPDINFLGIQDFKTFAFCNYFIATRDFWNKYFKFVDKILDSLDAEAAINDDFGQLLSSSAGYQRDLTLTIRPFFIERLFSTFLIDKNIKSVAFEYSCSDYGKRFGEVIGTTLYDLSRQKSEIKNNVDTNHGKWISARDRVFQSPIFNALSIEDLSDYLINAG